MSGIDLIRKERARQRSRQPGGECYSLTHDDEHDAGEIARAAAVYAMPPEFRARNQDLVAVLTPPYWYLKLGSGDRRRELVKAGALIAAEIDRLERAAVSEERPWSDADTFRIRAAIEGDYTTVGAHAAHAALDRLLTESERLRAALEAAAVPLSLLGKGSLDARMNDALEIIRAALAAVPEKRG